MGAIRVTDGHFARKYRRVKARSCHGVALGAVKHSLPIALYHMLMTGELYKPPTANPDAERRARARTTKCLQAGLRGSRPTSHPR